MAFEQVGVQFIAAGGDVYITTMQKATNATNSFVSTTEQGGGRISGAGQVMIGALRQVGAFAVDALGKAAQATGKFLTDSVDLAGDFQAGMLEFQAVAGKDVDTKGLDKFHDLFLQLGKELPVSTSEVQQAAIEMVKGGIDPAIVAAGGLRQNIQFAAAAMKGDLAGAAEISAKVLGGWADANATAAQKADFLTHSTDMLTKAANASSVDVRELSLGIFNAQGTAKAAGVSFDDLTTTLAELAPRFASSSEAGTSLKNMIARLQPQTNKQTGAMQALGLYTEEAGSAFYDAQGNFVGFAKASELLRNATKDLTNEQRAEMLQTIFGNDAMGAASALAELGAQGYNNMAAALDKANGVQANAALKQQGYNTALENAKGSVEALQITLGEKLLPVLTTLLNDYIAPGINAITQFADAVFGSDEAFNALSPDLQALVTVIDAVSQGFSEGGLLGAINQLLPSITGTSLTVQQMAADVQPAFNAVLSAGQTVFGTLETYIPQVLDVISGYIEAVLKQVVAFWEENGDEIMAFTKETWKTIADIVSTLVAIVSEVIIKNLKEATAFINAHGKEIQQLFHATWQIISGILTAALALISGALHIALDIIRGDWKQAWEDVKATASSVWEGIKTAIMGALEFISGLFGKSLAQIQTNWQTTWQGIKDYVSSIDWTALGVSIIDGMTGGLLSKAHALYDAIADVVNSAFASGEEAADAHSPARKFIPIGQNMTAGIAVGADEAAPLVNAAVSRAVVSPIANAMQIAAGARGNTTTYNQNRTLNMPIYTNMTPAAITQSAAIAGAMLT